MSTDHLQTTEGASNEDAAAAKSGRVGCPGADQAQAAIREATARAWCDVRGLDADRMQRGVTGHYLEQWRLVAAFSVDPLLKAMAARNLVVRREPAGG